MSQYQPPVYLYTLKDVSGVAAANNFLSVFNPANSGKIQIALTTVISTYSLGVTNSPNSLSVKRTTAASAGTLVAASTVERFATFWPNPSSVVRIGNPTVTAPGLPLAAFAPIISTGTGATATSLSNPQGASFAMAPGEGLVFYTDAGDVDQVWNITYVWMEIDI